MPWYHISKWNIERSMGEFVQIGNDHFVASMREDPDTYHWIGETECHLEVVVPGTGESRDGWVLSGQRPRKCPICLERRRDSSTASARPASRLRSGTARTSRRSAPAATPSPARTRRRSADD